MRMKQGMRLVAGLLLAAALVTGSGCGKVVTVQYEGEKALEAFKDKFYFEYEGKGSFSNDTSGGKQGFWSEAEMIEIVEDAWETTGNESWKNMTVALCNGFVAQHGTDWSGNKFNDDIMWMVLVTARAAEMTGDPQWLRLSEQHFDMVWSRGWSEQLGGGIWWTTDNHEKNTCINAPAAVAAMRLYQLTGNKAYHEKARTLYAWLEANLCHSDTGAADDHVTVEGKNGPDNYTYNQGTWLGAAVLLYRETGDKKFLKDARAAAEYTMKHMCSEGILKDEGVSGDGAGFKGIFARYMRMLIREDPGGPWLKWMQKNAGSVWEKRRVTDGLTYANWGTPCPQGLLYAFGCSTGVSVLINTPKQ